MKMCDDGDGVVYAELYETIPDVVSWYSCDICNYMYITEHDKYCGGCGRKIKEHLH